MRSVLYNDVQKGKWTAKNKSSDMYAVSVKISITDYKMVI